MAPGKTRLPVPKTYKLYIGGKFPRTESGRYLSARAHGGGGLRLAEYCRASRKDFRDAVRVARKSQPGWADASPYLKGQILYRAAEMLEGRLEAVSNEIQDSTGMPAAKARAEAEAAVDRLVYFAGWSDKISQVFGTVNPVASSFFNFSTLEPTGTVGIICPDRPPLLPLVSMLSSAVIGGNSVVILASETAPLPAITFAEVLATSDLPAGVVNILTGRRAELGPHFASHMDLNAIIDGSGDEDLRVQFEEGVALNLKRVSFHDLSPVAWFGKRAEDPYRVLNTLETKTTWHPIGL